MTEYPTLCISKTFFVTILGSQVPTINNQTYVVSSTLLNITFDPFVILPKNYSFTKPIVRTLTAYYVANSTQSIGLTTVGLT